MDMPQSAVGGQNLGLGDSIYNRLLKERIIWLGDQVTDELANMISAQLLLLAAEDPDKDIYLYINSPGGFLWYGHLTCNVKPDVATVGMGWRHQWVSSTAGASAVHHPHTRSCTSNSGGVWHGNRNPY